MQQAIELFRSVEAKEAEAGQQAAKPVGRIAHRSRRGPGPRPGRHRHRPPPHAGRPHRPCPRATRRSVCSGCRAWRRWLCRRWCRGREEILVQRMALTPPRHLRFPGRRIRPDSQPPSAGHEEGRSVPDRVCRQAGRPQPHDGRRGRRRSLAPPGLVIEEIRPGYYWKDKVIRFAEVRAVRERANAQ